MKHLLFKHYWWSGLLLLAIVLVSASWRGIFAEPSFTIALTGSIVSFFYFVQKQALEETRLFKELFDSFNGRYNAMNEKLARIAAKQGHESLSLNEEACLIDYFNLCAEEYVYFRRGYLPPEVWYSWSKGMLDYYNNTRIRTLWDKELRSGSYYGFRLSGEIEAQPNPPVQPPSGGEHTS